MLDESVSIFFCAWLASAMMPRLFKVLNVSVTIPYGTGKHISVASSASFVWQADGDVMGEAKPLEIILDPEQVTIIV